MQFPIMERDHLLTLLGDVRAIEEALRAGDAGAAANFTANVVGALQMAIRPTATEEADACAAGREQMTEVARLDEICQRVFKGRPRAS